MMRLPVPWSALAAVAVLAAAPLAAQDASVVHAFVSAPSGVTSLTRGSDGAFYGTTEDGGRFQAGVVFRVLADGTGLRVLHDFAPPPRLTTLDVQEHRAARPRELVARDGVLYGTTDPIPVGPPTLFRLNEDGSGFAIVHRFGDEGPPVGRLAVTGDFVYGTADYGRLPHGSVFRVRTDGADFTVLHAFEARHPVPTGLVEDGGVLYGVTGPGRAGVDEGTVFRLLQDGSGFETLHTFSGGDDGGAPGAVEIVGKAILGVTGTGGPFQKGTLFTMEPSGRGFRVLYPFDARTGTPFQLLAAGKVLHASSGGAGGFTITRIDLSRREPRVETVYRGEEEDRGPLFGADDGVLFGWTPYDVFRIDVPSRQYRVLLDLSLQDGAYPTALTRAGGVLFGTASGGRRNCGVVYRFDEDSGAYAPVHVFVRAEGCVPSTLVESEGTLYGVTLTKGAHGAGTLFRMSPDGSGFAVLHHFHDAMGGRATGLAVSGARVFTAGGTAQDGGALLAMDTDGTHLTVLRRFSGVPGGLLLSNGLLYGTVAGGGPAGRGVIYRIGVNGSGFTEIHGFVGGDGEAPQAPLIAAQGLLFGVTAGGGLEDHGVVFALREDGSGFRKLHDFRRDGVEGTRPLHALVESEGILYGTCAWGGAYRAGTAFVLAEDGSEFVRIHDYDGAQGMGPMSLLGSTASLIGTANYAGPLGAGTLLRLTPPMIQITGAAPLDLGKTRDGVAGTPTRTYTVAGTSLLGNVQVSAPRGVEISKDGPRGPYLSRLVLKQEHGQLPPTTIDVRLAASAPRGPANGGLVHTTPGTVRRTLAVKGLVEP